jgi:hypothetical protein
MANRHSRDPEVGDYVLPIDQRWNLADLSGFPRVYEQIYDFLASFYIPKLHGVSDEDDTGISYIFRSFPWQGGYSAVNFYNSLRSKTPRAWRPTIRSIHYASPGAIELTMAATVAFSLKTIVGHVVAAAEEINKRYGKGIIDRKLQKIKIREKELELDKADVRFAIESSEALAKALGFEDLAALHRRTGNPVASLRILLSFYRRVRSLSSFVKSGKANILESGPRLDDNSKQGLSFIDE